MTNAQKYFRKKKNDTIKKMSHLMPEVWNIILTSSLILFLSWALFPSICMSFELYRNREFTWICIIIIIINEKKLHNVIRNECIIFLGLEDLHGNVKLAVQDRWAWLHVCGIWDLFIQPKKAGSAVRKQHSRI